MRFDNYKFVLKTCASSENEVTGKDIDLEDRFECDLQGVTLTEGMSLFSPKKEVWKKYGIENLIFPDFIRQIEIYWANLLNVLLKKV